MSSVNNFNNPFNGGTTYFQPGFNYPSVTRPYYTTPSDNNQIPMIRGRMINSETDIIVNEVPMDGSVGVFPTRDYSRIYAKSWTRDGTIATVEYAPVVSQAPEAVVVEEPKEDPTQKLLSNIIDRLERMEEKISHKPNYQNNKKNKGDVSNE